MADSRVWRSEHVGTPAEIVDWSPDPLAPENIWASACVHAVAALYGIKNRQQWHAHPHYKKLALRLQNLYGRGLLPHDLPRLIKGEIPWPL